MLRQSKLKFHIRKKVHKFYDFCFRRRRSRSRPRSRAFDHYDDLEPSEARTMLMTNAEAVHSLYGEISTERDGDLTHQCIQTNLADVICGGLIKFNLFFFLQFNLI